MTTAKKSPKKESTVPTVEAETLDLLDQPAPDPLDRATALQKLCNLSAQLTSANIRIAELETEAKLEAKPNSVYAKLLKVMAAVENIPKKGYNQAQSYYFRREEDVTAAIHTQFVAEGLLFLPGFYSHTCRQIRWLNQAGEEKSADIITANLRYKIVDAETGDSIERPWVGEGTDRGDKGIYKAFTGALKYFLSEMFLISTGDDPEHDAKDKGGSRASAGGSTPSEKAPSTSSGASSYSVIDEELSNILERFSRLHDTLEEGQHYPSEWCRDFIRDHTAGFNKDGDRYKMTEPQAKSLKRIWADLQGAIKAGTIPEISGMLGD